MGYGKKGEVYPLLTTDWLGTPTYRQKPQARHIRQDDEEEIVEFDDEDEVFNIIDEKKKRSVNLVWMDVVLLIVDFLQIFALIQSMSLRWVYPERWLRNTYYVFAINIDIWEIMKFTNSSVYRSLQGSYLDSSEVGISYEYIIYAWFGGVAFVALVYGLLHASMVLRLYPQQRARRFMSWVQLVCMLVIHVLSLPLGIILFRAYECESLFSKVYTMNQYECFTVDYWKFGAPALIYIFALFVVYPAFLIWKTRQEGMTGTSDGHLSFILMKETEYKLHLNRAWLFDSMWMFSSFKYRGRYYRAVMQIIKLILLIIYAAAFNYIKTQSLLTTIFLLLVFIAAVFVRPYRLTSCNVFLIFCLFCNMSSSFIGSLLSNYTTATNPSAWYTADYIYYFLMCIQLLWLLSLIVLLVYLGSRTLCHSAKCCYKRSVWPNIATSGSGQLTTETKKFMTAIIKAKIAHEKIQRVPAMFAPVHDLARHIHIINAYCREAEYIGDALHMVLWQVLDDLVETHSYMCPKSLFSESVKRSIRKTAADFMTMVPMFSQRLAQRDYDFILIPPRKKRLLLKMYIMGLFLNGRAEKVAKKKLLQPAVEKVWPPLPAHTEFEEEDGYYEDLYPQPVGDNYSDDLLNVIVDDSTDAESTEEEDNVQGMLRNLPEVGIVDLETPVVDEPGPNTDDDDDDDFIPPPFPKQRLKFGHVSSGMASPRPLSATSKTSSSSSSSAESKDNQRRSASPSLFGSKASLRPDVGGVVSPGRILSPPRPSSTNTGRSLSPTATSLRPSSAGSSHSGSGRSPTVRPASGSSVVSSQPSRRGSQELSDGEMAAINPGYVPDQEDEEASRGQTNGDNLGYVPDDGQDGSVSDVTMATTTSKGSRSKKTKKPKKGKKPE